MQQTYKIIMIGFLTTFIISCTEKLEIKQDYSFSVSHLPVPKRIAIDETVEIRFTLERENKYKETTYYLRYFQTDGKGELKMEDGTVLLPNDLYELKEETFRLYFTSHSSDTHSLDLYFIDSFGKMEKVSFSFTNSNN